MKVMHDGDGWLVSRNNGRTWTRWTSKRLLFRCPDCSAIHEVPKDRKTTLPPRSKLVRDHGQRADDAIVTHRG